MSIRWRPSRSSTSVWRGTSWPGGRLAIAVIVVAAAIAAIGIVFSVQGYQDAKRDVRLDRGKLARDTAVEASSLVAIRLEYLSGIAASGPVETGDRPAMRALFRAMLGRRLVVDDIGWVRADGKGAVVAGRPPSETEKVDLSGRRYLRVVRETQRPYVSDAILSGASRVPIIVLAVPAFDRAHRLTGVVTGVLRLDELRPALRALRLGDTVQIVDRQGHIVVDAAPTGTLRSVANLALLRELQSRESGIREGVVGLNGQGNELVAYAGSSDTGWTVVVSEPVSSVYGPARNALINDVLRWIGLLIGVCALAYLAGRRLERTTRDRVTRTADFVDAASRMTAATTVSEIAEIYNEAVRKALGAVSATVAVVERDEIVPYFAHGTRNEELWPRLPWESPAGAAIVTRGRVQAGSPEALRTRFPGIVDGLAQDKVPIEAICTVPFPARRRPWRRGRALQRAATAERARVAAARGLREPRRARDRPREALRGGAAAAPPRRGVRAPRARGRDPAAAGAPARPRRLGPAPRL